jgi:hypothetical protein
LTILGVMLEDLAVEEEAEDILGAKEVFIVAW